MRSKVSIFSIAFLISSWLVAGCDIEESRVNSGKIFVELHDSTGAEVIGARIFLNGAATAKLTPDTLTGLASGQYLVEASKPGYYQTSLMLTLAENELAIVSLLTGTAPIASIKLVDAPDGTALIVNNQELGVTPPSVIGASTGLWNVSAYLAGHMTNAPSRWTVSLSEGDTAQINAQFTAQSVGPNVGSLAHVFSLPSDLDSAIFRLQDYRGRIVLISFFFYTCAPCLAEFPHIQEIYADPLYSGWLEFFGVDAIDPWPLFRSYKSTHPSLGLTFPLLWDQQQTLRTIHYEVASCPTNLLIDPSGMIRYRWLGVTEGELRGAIESLIAEFDTEN